MTVPLAEKRACDHIGRMTNLTRTVRRALLAAPCSTRALARAAGVPHSTLVSICADDPAKHREATRALAHSVMLGLRAWASTCQQSADAIERTLNPGGRRAVSH